MSAYNPNPGIDLSQLSQPRKPLPRSSRAASPKLSDIVVWADKVGNAYVPKVSYDDGKSFRALQVEARTVEDAHALGRDHVRRKAERNGVPIKIPTSAFVMILSIPMAFVGSLVGGAVSIFAILFMMATFIFAFNDMGQAKLAAGEENAERDVKRIRYTTNTEQSSDD